MLLVTLVGLSCGGEERPQASARELITIRTLGNAYLEENRLDSAEVEFLKLTELAPDEPLGFANLGLWRSDRLGISTRIKPRFG